MPRRKFIGSKTGPKAGASLGITQFDYDALLDPGIIVLKVGHFIELQVIKWHDSHKYSLAEDVEHLMSGY